MEYKKKGKIMFQGTASNVGKSTVAIGVCRILTNDGYNVIPFKSQNMSIQSKKDSNGKEMGVAQVLQAQACNKEAFSYMNPILLKPCGNHISEVIVNGESVGKMSSEEYRDYKPSLVPKLREIFEKIEKENEIVVIEGAGSPAEINMNSLDLSNMEMAKISGSPVILIADIDRGGVFASIVGTLFLLGKDSKKVKGIIINKFRGNKKYFEDGLKMLEDIVKIPVLGVIPFMDINLEEEDGAGGKDLSSFFSSQEEKEREFDKLEQHLRKNINIEKLYSIIFNGS